MFLTTKKYYCKVSKMPGILEKPLIWQFRLNKLGKTRKLKNFNQKSLKSPEFLAKNTKKPGILTIFTC